MSIARRAGTAIAAALTVGTLALALAAPAHSQIPNGWKLQWPNTDFEKTSVDFGEITSVLARDRIPAIDNPTFGSIADGEAYLAEVEPVVSLQIDGQARAYPLQILTWHEIVNDELAGVPVSVTFCPLCNSAVAFDRRVGDQVLEFGTSGNLRFSDLIMYDRETETWWQQFLGEGIVGELTGTLLKMLPVRVESFASYKARFPEGEVLLIPNRGARDYGRNPYDRYDSSTRPFLFSGDMPEGIAPLAYVIAVEGETEAWSLDLLKQEGRIEIDDLVITWETGMSSALDARSIPQGQDLGNIVVQRQTGDGLVDVVHDLTFAFNFNAFNPGATINQ
ncbi:MAG: DUF3179 domain-containing protein [Alphaproteobacteria bacterium]